MEMEENFPVGMKVLAVDDDSTYLASLASLLRQCKYHVVTANTAMEALQILGENKDDEFALIISVIDHMPEMDGFELLQQVDDIPVIFMSSAIDDNKEVIMKGISHGACHYLSKPVPIEELKNIWQHVFRRKLESTVVRRQDERRKKDPNPEPSTQKKPPRFVWSQERHRKFVEAIDQLGMENAVPKKILELMNDKDIKRQHVASHLQKYKEQIKKPAGGHSTSGQLKKMDLSPSAAAAAAADPGINGDTQMSTGAHLVSYGHQLVSGTHNRQKRPPEIDDDTQMRVTKFDVGEQYEDITQIVDEYFDSDFSFKGIGGGGATAFDFADTNNLMIGEQHILIAPQAEVSGNPSSITPDYVPFDVDMFDNHNHFAESFGGPSVDLRDNTATSAAGAPTHLMMMMMMMNQHDQVSSLDSVFNTIPDTRTDLHHQNHSMNHIVSGQNTNDQYPIPAGPNILPEEFSMMRSVPKNYEGCLLSRQLGNGNITQQQQHHIVRQNTNQYQIPGPNILPPEEFSMVMSVPKNYEDCLLSRQLDNGKLTTLKKRRRL